MAVITRWLYYRGDCKAGFYCIDVFVITKVFIIAIFLVDIRHISVDPTSSCSVMKHSMPFIVTVFKNDLSS